MKKLLTTLSLGVSILAAGSAMAADVHVHNKTITEVYIHQDGTLLFKTSDHSPTENNADLSCTSNAFYKVTATSPAKEMMHKQLLTAKATGAPTWLRFNGCSYYPVATSISVK